MKNIKVVITGGPSSGKTTIINELLERGYVCFDEGSRELIKKSQENGIEQPFLDNPEKFNDQIISSRVQQYQKAIEYKSVVFFDRGVHDILSYSMDYASKEKFDNIIKICKETQYDIIFMLPPWEKIHVQDNERYETFEHAQNIYKELLKVYSNFGYQIIEVPVGKIEDRVQFILENLK